MSRGWSGIKVKATVSRTDENQNGSIRPAVIIWPFGPGCSSRFMPQNTPMASLLSATGGGTTELAAS
ncbi:Uncharacterised protein [Mycobacterium tuberculosis]|nr:Uncharacterised protein [Mycobacterium tuberculosis]